jgi:hypothetical protein
VYDAGQQRIIAYELARTGCNIPRTVKNLRDEYETFRGIGTTTVRRLLQNAQFTEEVASRTEIIKREFETAIRETERTRARQELEGSMLGELRADDQLLEDSRNRLNEVLQDSEKVSPQLAVQAFALMSKLIDQRRARALPVVASTRQMSLLITIFAEESQSMFGPEKALAFRKRVRERYAREIESQNSVDEPPPQSAMS